MRARSASPGLKSVVVDGLVDELELGRVDVQVAQLTSERRLSELMMIASATLRSGGTAVAGTCAPPSADRRRAW